MKLSNKVKLFLLILLLVLNVVFRIQISPREIGVDSFEMHIMTNSLSEYGYAKWILNPLSFIGLYPASYASAMQFLISGISQSMGMDNDSIIFSYGVFIGILSMFTAYLMAGEIVDDDMFKILAAFGYSTALNVLNYSILTIPTRGLFLVLAPLLIFFILRCRKSIKYVPITFILAIFLLATHHLFYFLIPAFFSFFILINLFRFNKYTSLIKFPEKLKPILFIMGFIIMFLIPFLTGRFIEHSRYSSIDTSYVRYVGILIIPAIGGLGYLIFKNKKSFGETFLLLTVMFLFIFVYEQTYMKDFLPLFVIPLSCIGLMNIFRSSGYKSKFSSIFVIFLLLSVIFAGFYMFIHNYRDNPYDDRNIEESTYDTGKWMKNNVNGQGISNDELFGSRIFAVSDTTHILTHSSATDPIYGFIKINLSNYKRYSLTSDNFWFSGYEGLDIGEITWESVNNLRTSPYALNITYFVENTNANGNLIWNHAPKPSILLSRTYNEGDLVYDTGNARIWKLE